MLNDKMYVQFGCGLCAPEDWVNFDISPTLRFQRLPGCRWFATRLGPRFPKNARYGDIVKGLPILKKSCQGLYSSHVLEHLALDDFRTALRNAISLLRPGGFFRFVVPNMEQLARDYLEDQDSRAVIKFFETAHLGVAHRPRGFAGLVREWLGNSRHLWMWDFKGLKSELEAVGFGDVRRAYFGDSEDRMFDQVEDTNRWDRLAVGVQLKQPA